MGGTICGAKVAWWVAPFGGTNWWVEPLAVLSTGMDKPNCYYPAMALYEIDRWVAPFVYGGWRLAAKHVFSHPLDLSEVVAAVPCRHHKHVIKR